MVPESKHKTLLTMALVPESRSKFGSWAPMSTDGTYGQTCQL